jgi:type IX secretion system PorP/SprF family membrane protein
MIIKLIKLNYLILFCIGLCLVTSLTAQQKPEYTQYVLNNYILNPALSGIENYVDIKISHRQQWVGLSDAPATTYITIQGPIGKQDYATSATSLFDIPGENPRGKDYWDNYRAAPAHHGIGLQIIADQAGLFTTTNVMGTYAYHMPLGEKTNLSAGIGIGVNDMALNTDKIMFDASGQQTDPAVFGGYGNVGKVQLDMSAGLWLYSSNYFVGVSALQLVPESLDYADNGARNVTGKLVPHYFGTAGYRFLITDDINALPSIMVKDVAPLPMQVDLNMKLAYRNDVWVGGSYRGGYGFAAMAGFNALNLFTLSYSYDYTTTELNTVSNGTHEIIVGFIIGNKFGDTCPRNVW